MSVQHSKIWWQFVRGGLCVSILPVGCRASVQCAHFLEAMILIVLMHNSHAYGTNRVKCSAGLAGQITYAACHGTFCHRAQNLKSELLLWQVRSRNRGGLLSVCFSQACFLSPTVPIAQHAAVLLQHVRFLHRSMHMCLQQRCCLFQNLIWAINNRYAWCTTCSQ